jgi:chemotaxis protein histidine kinase CheA
MASAQQELEQAVWAAFAEEAKDLLRQVERSLHGLAGGEASERAPRCLEMLRGLHTLKGAAATVSAEQVKQAAHALEDQVRGVLEGTVPMAGGGLESIFDGLERLYDAVEAALKQRAPAPQAAPEAPLGLAAAVLASPRPAAPAVEPPEPAAAAGQGGPAMEEALAAAASTGRGTEEFLRVPTARVDALSAQVGEFILCRLQLEALVRRLVEARDRLGEAVEQWRELGARMEPLRRTLPLGQWQALKAVRDGGAPALSGAFHVLSGVVREAPSLLSATMALGVELEEGIRGLRLLPLQPFLEEYGRVVREAARACGKEVRLEVRAAGAEVDRVVLMRLREVLLHLVRNAVVHGVESPERRRAAGKPEVGTVVLEARCEGARALLRVADDGAGIDVERVRQKARETGLAVEERELDGEELLALLSRPGFSTRREVDELAGRGIGMDVVVSTLRELDGQLSLEHARGQGTAFTLDVPVSTSIHQGLVVQVEEHRFGLLLPQVERALRVGPGDVAVLEKHSVVQVGGESVAVVPLAGLLGLKVRGTEALRRPAVVLRQGRQRLVVLVDDIPGEQRLVIKPLGPAFAGSPLVGGGAVQPDGSVLPVLHVQALFARAAGETYARSAAAALAPERSPQQTRVLVVDDSPTMRTLLRNVLRAAGYQVEVAQDGLAALEVLRQQPYSLVVTDLQMPRMDGIGVCQFIRRSSSPHTPVILVTSLSGQESRQRAREAGVDAFMVKGEFEQSGFLELVRMLTRRGGAGEAVAG